MWMQSLNAIVFTFARAHILLPSLWLWLTQSSSIVEKASLHHGSRYLLLFNFHYSRLLKGIRVQFSCCKEDLYL